MKVTHTDYSEFHPVAIIRKRGLKLILNFKNYASILWHLLFALYNCTTQVTFRFLL